MKVQRLKAQEKCRIFTIMEVTMGHIILDTTLHIYTICLTHGRPHTCTHLCLQYLLHHIHPLYKTRELLLTLCEMDLMLYSCPRAKWTLISGEFEFECLSLNRFGLLIIFVCDIDSFHGMMLKLLKRVETKFRSCFAHWESYELYRVIYSLSND